MCRVTAADFVWHEVDILVASVFVYTSVDYHLFPETISSNPYGPEIDKGFNKILLFTNTVATGSTTTGLGIILADLRALFSSG